MPKLITKQDVGTAGYKIGQSQWLSFGGLVLLLVVVAGAAYFFTRPVITSPIQEPLALDSVQDQSAKSNYLAMHAVFNELSAEYEQVSAQSADDYQKNIKLLGKSEGILAHLDKMNFLAGQLKLADSEYGRLINRHQFNKDYWQAKLHFRQLRVSRFESGELNMAQDSVVTPDPLTQHVKSDTADESLAVADKPKKFQFAKPPPGMELPAGFCDLSNPASCKPEAAVNIADVIFTLPESIPDNGVAEQPKKFKFAKPPSGMELPAGFCDLSNPASCKPEADATIAIDENSNSGSNAN